VSQCVPGATKLLGAAPSADWLLPEINDACRCIPVDVLFLPDRCYRCRADTAAVVGIWVAHRHLDGYEYGMHEEPGGWFLAYDETSAEVIATACTDETLAAQGAGPLRWRTTHACPDGYLANTCIACGTVLGNWPLYESLLEYRAEGGQLRVLPRLASEVAMAAIDQLGGAVPD
jgi:hypothetical protein